MRREGTTMKEDTEKMHDLGMDASVEAETAKEAWTAEEATATIERPTRVKGTEAILRECRMSCVLFFLHNYN